VIRQYNSLKQGKWITHLRVDPDERLPKFIRDGSDHSYATVGKTLKQTPKKQTPKTKRKREREQHTNRQNSSSDFQMNISV